MIDVQQSAVRIARPVFPALVVGLIAVFAAPAVHAQESTTVRFVNALNPYASASYTADNNIFRLSDDDGDSRPPEFSEVVDSGRSDQYSTFTAGIDFTGAYSQQEFLLNGFIFRTDYDDYSDFDYSGGQALGQWNWKFGRGWDGDLGYKYDKRLRSFENQLVPKRDLREESKFFGSVNRRVAANWLVNLRTSLSDITFSETTALDLDRNVYGGAVKFKSRSGNELGFDAEYTDGDFKDDDFKNFTELDIGPTLDWQATDRIKLAGKVGWTWRDNDAAAREDYDDLTGRVTIVRKGDDGNKVLAKVWREVTNLGDEIANFALVHGVSVEPQWRLTSKITLKGLLSYEDRDFKGRGLPSDEPLPDLDSRDDQLYRASVTADWQFNKIFLFSVAATAGERDSNRDFEEFDFRELRASVKAQF